MKTKVCFAYDNLLFDYKGQPVYFQVYSIA